MALCKVLRLIKSSDGVTRGAKLKSSKSNTTVCRPINLLCPLEISSTDVNAPIINNDKGTESNSRISSDRIVNAKTKPRREAAQIGEHKRRFNLE